jgi:hypothetical protein
MTAGIGRSGGASSPLCLLCVEILVRFREKLFDTLAIAAVDGYADTRGDRRLFAVAGENFADATRNSPSFVFLGFRENEGEFVPAISRGGIDGAAVNAENIGEAADGAAADEMAVAVVYCFQVIKVEKQHGEGPAGAIGALRLVFKNIEQAAVVGETGERIADGKMVNLLEEPRVIEKCPTQRDGIAQDQKRLGENEGSVEQARGLSGRELRGDIQPGGGINGAVELGIFDGQAAAVPDETHEKNRAGQQLLGIGEEGAGMPRDFRRQTAKRGGEHVGQRDHGQQSAGNFAAWMTRTREEALNEKRHDKQECQDHAAKPPSDGRPKESKRGVRKKLKKENAGRRKDSAGKKKTSAENKGNAILSSLEPDKGYGGENKGEKAADDLQVALENGIGLKSNAAEPVSSQDHKKKSTDMRQEDPGVTAAVRERSIAHRFSRIYLYSPGQAPT